ncbi:MAG: GAF domain-containing protein [Roseiflexaceae bacterium]|nr:GAF domain-containing protein [Roseiflexaceae bacterium]
MVPSLMNPVSLLGALLVSEGLLTHAQLIACLMIQKEEAAHLPLGQITVHCGYVSQEDLDRVLLLQQEVRTLIMDEIDTRDRAPADLAVLIMASQRKAAINRYLLQLGTRPSFAGDAVDPAQSPDLVLIDQNNATNSIQFPGNSFVGLLPTAASNDDQLSKWEQQLINGYVTQVRERNRLRAAAETEQRAAFLIQQFSALNRRMARSHSKQDMMVQLMAFIRDVISIEAGTLYQIDLQARELIFSIVMGPHQEELYHKRFSIDHGIAGWVARNGEPLLIPDVRKDTRFEQMFDKKTGFQTHSVLCVPIRAQRTTLGVIQLINKIGDPFDEHDLFLLRIAAGIGALVYLLDDTILDHQGQPTV